MQLFCVGLRFVASFVVKMWTEIQAYSAVLYMLCTKVSILLQNTSVFCSKIDTFVQSIYNEHVLYVSCATRIF